MVGVINSWDVLWHPAATIQCFGWRVFFRAIVPWREETFLSLLQDAGCFGGGAAQVPAILDRCIALELRAKRIYETLAASLARGGCGPFFAGLAVQEQFHADLLGVCRAAAQRGRWKATLFTPWQDYLPRLEHQMDAAVADVAAADSVESALHMVIEIESAEINRVFNAALAATDTAFVQRLKPFRDAMEAHMTYIVEELPKLSPKLLPACRELRARFPRVTR